MKNNSPCRRQNSKSGFAILGVIIAYLIFVSATLFVMFFMNQRRTAVRSLEASRHYLMHLAIGTEEPPGGIGDYEVEEKKDGDFDVLDVITDHPDEKLRSQRRVSGYPDDFLLAPSCEDEQELGLDSALWQRQSCRRDYKQHTRIYYNFFKPEED